MASSIPNDNITMPAAWRGKAPVLVAVGAVCVLISLGLFMMTGSGEKEVVGFRAFWHSYLANFIYCLSICLGATFFVLVQHVTRAGWSASIRRLAELLMVTIPSWAILFVPIVVMLFMGNSSLYSWNRETEVLPTLVQAKVGYLNPQFFFIRALIYFGVWILAGRIYFSMSRQQDDTGSTDITLKLQRWAGPFIILFGLSVNFAAFDWIMSTNPEWYSTIFGVYLFAASMLSFFATMILLSHLLQVNGRLEKFVNTEHFHDLAKFQFGFVVFWGYIAFSQFLLYWYGNIPEETIWYQVRITRGWQYVGYILIAFHFALPLLGTLPRAVRRYRAVMAGWAGFILVVHWIDMTFLLMPNVGPLSFMLILSHIICWVGMVSLFVALFLLRVGETPLVATKDPWLNDALAYHIL